MPRVSAVNLIRRLFDNRLISARGQKDQFKDAATGNKWLPRPDESYPFWNAYACEHFDKSYLLNQTATPAEQARLRKAISSVRKLQGKPHVTAKLTGPGRIKYLHSVWPDLKVVHVVRDGLDVVRSLLGGDHAPWWQGGLSMEDLQRWEQEGKHPAALAAMQWRTIIQTTRQEAKDCLGANYIEMKYEDFMADSIGQLSSVFEKFDLDREKANLQPLQVRNKSYAESWDSGEREELIKWLNPAYAELGYQAD